PPPQKTQAAQRRGDSRGPQTGAVGLASAHQRGALPLRPAAGHGKQAAENAGPGDGGETPHGVYAGNQEVSGKTSRPEPPGQAAARGLRQRAGSRSSSGACGRTAASG